MGKSGKKSKLDKINALRKQYDAFLEEDKKRKDRNEYILGRMETMRSCTALVHVRFKAYPKIEESIYPTQPKYKSTMAHTSNSAIALSGRTHVSPIYLNKNDDEPSVLKEISKKYFLIPKVMSNDVYNINYKENDRDLRPNDDWKSKYNILEELKREEKGDHPNTIVHEKQNNLNDPYEDNKNSEYIAQDSNDKSFIKNNSTSLELTPSKLETNKFSNQELSYNNLEVKPNQNNNKQVHATSTGENIEETDSNMEKQVLVPQLNKLPDVHLSPHDSLPKISQVENKIKQEKTSFSTNNKINEVKESNELREDKLSSKMELIEAVENKKYVPEEKKSFEFNDTEDNTDRYTLSNESNYVSPIVSNERTQEVTKENTMEVNNGNTMEGNKTHNANNLDVNNENNAFSVKNIEDNQEFVHNENTVRAQGVYEEVAGQFQDDPETDTGHQEYQLQESDLNNIPNVEQNVNSEVNDELQTEQQEMFYSEDNVKTDEYNEHDSTAYTAENENYVNQEYSYYDESQKEQTYPTEINEHEESTERYDPNYEQQYVNNYEDTMNTAQYQPEQYNVENSYDQQQNMYDQPENPNYEYAPMESANNSESNQNVYYTNAPQETAQYEAHQVENSETDQQNIAYTSEDYDTQQEYITMQTEPLQMENVEHQLDIEDGYIPNTNIVAENQDYQEQVIEETKPEIQETDIKVT